MGRKCSVPGCKTGYDSQVPRHKPKEHIRMYSFPKDVDSLRVWLKAFPTKLSTNKITDNMGVCALHWPEKTKYVRRGGKHFIPIDPPSIFPFVDEEEAGAFTKSKSFKFRSRSRSTLESNQSSNDARPYATADFIGVELEEGVKPKSRKEDIKVDQGYADVKPTLDADGKVVPEAKSIHSALAPTVQGLPSFCARLNDQPDQDAHKSQAPSDWNPILSLALSKPAVQLAVAEPFPSQLKPSASLTDGGSLENNGVETFVVNMDTSWRFFSPSQHHEDENEDDEAVTHFNNKSKLGMTYDMTDKGEPQSQNSGLVMTASSSSEKNGHLEITAKYIMSKLSLISDKQRILAEKLVADVLLEAEFGNLTPQSKLNIK